MNPDGAMTSRRLVRAFFRDASCPRPPLLPLAFYHAARLDGSPPNLLIQDPTRLTRALADQQRLLGADCVTLRFDAPLLAELAGMPVRWSPAGPAAQWEAARECEWPPPDPWLRPPISDLLEVIRRLRIQLRKEAPILVVLPGPVSLCRLACADSPEKVEETIGLVRGLAEEACRAGAEVVVLEEAGAGGGEEIQTGEVTAATESICNTVRYYNAYSVLCASRNPARNAADALLLHPPIGPDRVPPDIRAGVFAPPTSFKTPKGLAEFISALEAAPRPVFLTTGDDTLLSYPIGTNVALFTALRQVHWG